MGACLSGFFHCGGVDAAACDYTHVQVAACEGSVEVRPPGGETVRMHHVDLPVFRDDLPDDLRVLEITYCGLREFAPSRLPTAHLVEIDLSFNRLREIPRCLWDLPRGVRVQLDHNDMWFDMYSNLNPSVISAATVPELQIAHRLGLVSTTRMIYVQKVLSDNRDAAAADAVRRWISAETDARAGITIETHFNKQNVHLRSVQESAKQSVRVLMDFDPHPDPLETLAVREESNGAPLIRSWFDNRVPHSQLGVTFADVLSRAVAAAMACPNPTDVLAVIRDEVLASRGTCTTGRITRVLNALGGFVPGIGVCVSASEELSNSVIAVRRKYAAIYANDPEQYVREAVPVVWQLLEDACVPEAEHGAWLDAV